jgi:hypothetical protein
MSEVLHGWRPARNRRNWLGGRQRWLLLAMLIAGAAVALGWRWLAAVGVLPLLLSALPCLAMCTLGLCMNRASGRGCSQGAGAGDASPTSPSTPPAR